MSHWLAHRRNVFDSFLHIEFHQNMVVSNTHFGYQMFMDFLRFGIKIAGSISVGRVSLIFQFFSTVL